MRSRIGIDFGTNTSLVAYVHEGQPAAVRNPDNHRWLTPSVLHLNTQGQWIAGDEARSYLISQPERTVYAFKQLVGKSRVAAAFSFDVQASGNDIPQLIIDGKAYTLETILALFFGHLRLQTETYLQSEISAAVVGVPGYFGSEERGTYAAAAALAGFEDLQWIEEPVAACMGSKVAEGIHQPIYALTFDLGGGTFDAAVVECLESDSKILGMAGHKFLGSAHLDRLIIQHWEETGQLAPGSSTDDPSTSSLIRLMAESAKKTLSRKPDFYAESGGLAFSLTKDELEEISMPFMGQTLKICDQALATAGLAPNRLNEIVLIGGTTRSPLLVETLERHFQLSIRRTYDPEAVVAFGAAMRAADL